MTFPFVLSTPSPLRGTRPCPRGRVSYNRLVLTSAGHYTPVRASHRSVLPSQGTDGQTVHLLKTLFAPCGRAGEESVKGGSVSSFLSPFLPQGKKGSNRQVGPADIKFYLDCHYSDCMSFAGKALRDFSIPCWSLLCFYFITGRIGWSVWRPFVHILIISLDINKAYAS